VSLLAALAFIAGNASARVSSDPKSRSANAPVTTDAFALLQPGAAGNCAAPPNGGTVMVGCRFVLNLMVNAGGNAAPNGTTAHQDRITYTYSLIQNARVSSIVTSCVPTNTLTADVTVYDCLLQNEVCNGPGNCTFRGVQADPGTLSYASGPLANCPEGCPDPNEPPPLNQQVFRVAQVGLCAIAAGQAVFHWQFDPLNLDRDSEVINLDGNIVSNPALYTDYIINIVNPTDTPTPTPTGEPTRTPGGNAFHFFQPGAAGNCAAPPNGGTVMVGCRFVLDLMIDAGSSQESCGHQAYLQVSNQLIKNARVTTIASACTLTSTVTGDLATYETIFQNEVCNGLGPNGDQPCVFRGVPASAGWFAFSSGALSNPPTGGVFRVARVGLCAVAPGQAVLHWQFSPPDPVTRDTEIVDGNGVLIHDPRQYVDYIINIVAATPTSTPTPPSLIIGHVNWQGAPAQPNNRQMQPITLTIKAGTTEVNFPSQATDANGYFTNTLPGLPNGTYNWRVKGPKFLANAGTVALTGAPSTALETGMLMAGDADNNMVNIVDFNILKNSFGKTVGDPGYDARADFNNDIIVSALDTNLHKINQGLAAPGPIGPGR
jgi:hypothetical protein